MFGYFVSFRLKTVLGIAIIEAFLLTVMIAGALYYFNIYNEKQLLKKGEAIAHVIAVSAGGAVKNKDTKKVKPLLEEAVANSDFTFANIYDQNNKKLVSAVSREGQGEDALVVKAPLKFGKETLGFVEVGVSRAQLQQTFEYATLWMIALALSEMLFVAILGWVLGTYLTRQLQSLRAGARQVAGGDFGHQISISGNDELSDAAKSFNRMSDSLRKYADFAESEKQFAEEKRKQAESTLANALDNMADGVLIIDANEKVVKANRSYRELYSLDNERLTTLEELVANQEKFYNTVEGEDFVANRLEKFRDPDIYFSWEEEMCNGVKLLVAQRPMSGGGVVIVETDVTEFYKTLEANEQLQIELMQKHKTDALGTLAGGIAHEINTPVQYISDNISFVADSMDEISAFIDELGAIKEGDQGEIKQSIETELEKLDWEFVREETPRAITEMKNGAERIRDLVVTFREFAGPSAIEVQPIDIKEAILVTKDISKSDWEPYADIVMEVEDELPATPCEPSQINQVLLHLITNASHAIVDKGGEGKGVITIRARVEQDDMVIEVEDNGCGIEKDNIERVFDPLYTTKGPGRGTGHGLALCETIIMKRHQGKISVQSEIGKGTTFTLKLPLSREEAYQGEAAIIG